MASLSCSALSLLLQFGNLSVLNFRSAAEVAGVARLIELQPELLQLRFGGAHVLDCFFFRLPLGLHAGRRFLQIGDALFDLFQSRFRLFIFFALQRLTLDFELNGFAFKLIDLLRQRIDLDAQSRSSFVDQVDCLVGQESDR